MKFITKGKHLDKAITLLIQEHDYVSMAVAWASLGTDSIDVLLMNKKKMRGCTIGTHFYQTDPDILASFYESPECKFVLQTHGVFHPKVYLGYSENGTWDMVIGSANWTKGAIKHNAEICVHISEKDDPKGEHFETVFNQIKSYFENESTQFLTKNEVDRYRVKHAIQQRNLSKLKGELKKGKKRTSHLSASGNSSWDMSWTKYYSAIRNDKNFEFTDRLALLEDVSRYFKADGSFAAMDIDTRKTIAGIKNPMNSKAVLFGHMGVNREWKTHVAENYMGLARALECIPTYGEVTDAHFFSYIDAFKQETGYLNAVALASRLITMKRPDVFCCVDTKNKHSLEDKAGISGLAKDYESYWLFISNLVHQCDWWNSPVPQKNKNEKSAWLGRAALLDALHYTGH